MQKTIHHAPTATKQSSPNLWSSDTGMKLSGIVLAETFETNCVIFVNFDDIEYRTSKDLTSKYIAELSHHHNPKSKKRVSREQFEEFLNEKISFADLKHLY